MTAEEISNNINEFIKRVGLRNLDRDARTDPSYLLPVLKALADEIVELKKKI